MHRFMSDANQSVQRFMKSDTPNDIKPVMTGLDVPNLNKYECEWDLKSFAENGIISK